MHLVSEPQRPAHSGLSQHSWSLRGQDPSPGALVLVSVDPTFCLPSPFPPPSCWISTPLFRELMFALGWNYLLCPNSLFLPADSVKISLIFYCQVWVNINVKSIDSLGTIMDISRYIILSLASILLGWKWNSKWTLNIQFVTHMAIPTQLKWNIDP